MLQRRKAYCQHIRPDWGSAFQNSQINRQPTDRAYEKATADHLRLHRHPRHPHITIHLTGKLTVDLEERTGEPYFEDPNYIVERPTASKKAKPWVTEGFMCIQTYHTNTHSVAYALKAHGE